MPGIGRGESSGARCDFPLPLVEPGAGCRWAEVAGALAGTVTLFPQVLQVAFRPAKLAGTENGRPHPSHAKEINDALVAIGPLLLKVDVFFTCCIAYKKEDATIMADV
jgi:hypothetical protein